MLLYDTGVISKANILIRCVAAKMIYFLDQFTLVKARSLIKRAYLEAFEVNEFVRKYFRKDLDLTKKAALEEDYLTNYLPFK